jgi:hypothetical protein
MDDLMIRIDRMKLKTAIREKFGTLLRFVTHLASSGVSQGLAQRTLENVIAAGRVRQSSLNTLAEELGKSYDYFLLQADVPWSLPTSEWERWRPAGALLRAEFRVVPFHFREKEMESLKKWCRERGDHHLFVKLFTGKGGMGKTRLAIELCGCMQKEGWRAGFLNYDLFQRNEQRWDELLKENVDLLLIFDYAEHHSEEIAWLLRTIIKRSEARLRLRFLMLARNAGPWWDSLLRSRDVGDLLAGAASYRHSIEPLAVKLEERAASYRAAGKAFCEKLNITAAPADSPNLNAECFKQVLLLHMAALAAVHGMSLNDQNAIFDYVLRRERDLWVASLREHDLPRALEVGVGHALAAVTAMQGIQTAEDGMFILERLSFFSGHPRSELVSVNHLLNDCYPGEKWVDPVQPDLLGQRLYALALDDPKLRFEIFALVRALKQHKRHGRRS